MRKMKPIRVSRPVQLIIITIIGALFAILLNSCAFAPAPIYTGYLPKQCHEKANILGTFTERHEPNLTVRIFIGETWEGRRHAECMEKHIKKWTPTDGNNTLYKIDGILTVQESIQRRMRFIRGIDPEPVNIGPMLLVGGQLVPLSHDDV